MRPPKIRAVDELRYRVMRRCVGFMFRVCALGFDGRHDRESCRRVHWHR